jgi:RNAse (barnase) inhibitor barstar
VTLTRNGTAISEPAEFYDQFFVASAGVVPDHGGRNLDALADDMSEVEQPLTIVWEL